MILEITVENLAIIEQSQLSLGPGLTVLTGETGAGKSLLIDAVELAIGERADSELVRSGAPKASVSLVLDLSNDPELVKMCAESGIDLEEGELLYIHREVFAEGRSQCRIGGKLAPVSSLKQLGQYLVDLHGQHDHQSLLDNERHIGFLDEWIGEPARKLLSEIFEAYGKVTEIQRKLDALRTSLRDREQRLDLLRFQVQEIEEAAPMPGETEDLESQLSRLKNVEKLATSSYEALNAISEQEGSAVELLGSSVKSLEVIAEYDPKIEEMLESLRSALYSAEELGHNLRSYVENLEADPNLLEEVAGRIDLLKKLQRKYGDTEEQILAHLEECKSELAVLEDSESSEESLEAELAVAKGRLDKLCAELTQLRTTKSKEFSQLVEKQLRELAMEKAIFEVLVEAKTADSQGADRIEFFFSANAGEPPRPLSKIASGGEISRVMLGIKTALAGKAGVPTLIFDEVDAGLGGREAAVVAKKLEDLALHYQVLVISHLPQIASRGTTHYRIEKGETSGRVVTQVRLLDPEARVVEVARMLAGENVTDVAKANAREMLAVK